MNLLINNHLLLEYINCDKPTHINNNKKMEDNF